jgi:hypothetical protein
MRARILGLILTLTFGCDDPGGFGSGTFTDAGPDAFSPPTGDAGPGTGGAEVPDMRRPRPDQGPAPDPDAVPAYVSMRLEPVQTLYTREDHPTVVAEVFDRFGEVIAGAPLAWSIAPAPVASVEASGGTGTLTFLQEGPGAVRACATPDLCGRATFFVDDGPPVLTLTQPTPGQVVMGRAIVTVAGTVTGTSAGDTVQVFVNDAPVEVGADGAFQVELPAQFGFNRVEVLADDGVQRPPVREVREALYAPRFLVPGASSVEIGDALALRLSQRLLDTDAPASEPDADGIVHVPDLAALLETLLARIEPLALLGDPVLAQGEPLDLTVESVSPGTPEVALVFTETGLDVFLRLTDLTITTRGQLMLEGVPVSLTGSVLVSAAAYARIAIVAGPGGEPGLRVEAADVALERVAGRMDDSTAQAVLDTFGSLLRTVIEDYARTTVDDLIRSRVPDFIDLGLGDVLATFADIPLDVASDGVIPELHLRAGFRLSAPVAVPRGHLTLTLSGTVRQPSPVQAPYPDPGIADETTAQAEADGPPWPAQAGAAVAVRMRAINTLLHELWRQGALRIDATTVIPENLRALLSGVRIDARLAPLVVAAPPGAPYLFELQAGEIDLFTQSARNPAPDLYTLSIRVGLTLVAEAGRLHFDLAPTVDVRAALRQAGGDRPFLPEDALSDLLSNLAVTELRKAIGNGLDIALDELHLGADTLGTLAPSVQDVHIVPTFPERPRVQNGWFVLGATLDTRLR